MRCKTCDYPLWNLKGRLCPECGTPFLPSEFEFVVNSVQFCCPHCEQAYYGTGTRGHIVPEEFNCVSCGRRITLNEMVLRPAVGVNEQRTQVVQMPWLERHGRGWFKAWLATVGMSMVMPGRLMKAVPEQSAMGPAYRFAVVNALIVGFAAIVPMLAFLMVLVVPATGGRPGGMMRGMLAVFGFPMVMIVLMPLALIVTVAPIMHFMLRLTGRTMHPLRRTMQAMSYSSGANVLTAVPCVGLYCGWMWWVVSAAIMMKDGQNVRTWRATLAAMVGTIVAIVIWVTAYFGGMSLLIAGLGPGMNPGMANVGTPMGETKIIGQAVINFASIHNGCGPTHALELVSAGLGAPNFISNLSNSNAAALNFGGTTLDKLDYLPANKQAMAIQAAAAALPPNVIAHRCGDFVFTYHGIDLSKCDPALWIVIYSPDPDVNGSQAVIAYAARADGVVVALGRAAPALAAQNQLRQQYNLPPLPDPSTVTHAKPAASNGND